jgi:hypothetical protein
MKATTPRKTEDRKVRVPAPKKRGLPVPAVKRHGDGRKYDRKKQGKVTHDQ